jgi:hypothetical protein
VVTVLVVGPLAETPDETPGAALDTGTGADLS